MIGTSLFKLIRWLQSDNDRLQAELSRTLALLAKERDEFKWLKRNYDENEMLVSDYTKLKADRDKWRGMAEKLAEALNTHLTDCQHGAGDDTLRALYDFTALKSRSSEAGE